VSSLMGIGGTERLNSLGTLLLLEK